MATGSPSPSCSASTDEASRSTPGRQKKSIVWLYFQYNTHNNKSVCQIVGQGEEICGKGKYPTNLKSHVYEASIPRSIEKSLKKRKLKKKLRLTKKGKECKPL